MRLIVAFVVVLACWISCSWALSASGNKILDANGNPILLRGVARPSLEWNPVGEGLSLSDYQTMKSWGANVVRLSLNQCYMLSGNEGYAPAYNATVAQQVSSIKSLGMYVILDLHWSNQGNTGTQCGQQVMPDSISITFWTGLANSYKNDPWVAFELYNEPHDVPYSVWQSGGATGGGWNTPGFQAIYNAVRGTGANNLVIIGGLDWAFNLTVVQSNPISGVNIAYSTHPYNTSDRPSSLWNAAILPTVKTYPVVATEFGNTASCDTSYAAQWLAYSDTNSISWTAFGWYSQGCSFPSIIQGSWGSVTPYPVLGSLIQNELTNGPKIPGTTASASATTKVSTVTSAATSASATTKVSTATSASATTKPATSTSTTGSATTGSASVTEVYVNSLVDSFQDWSWATRNLADGTQYHSSPLSISFVPANYAALYLENTGAIFTTQVASIQFWIYYVAAGTQVRFNMIQNSAAEGPTALVDTYTTPLKNPIPAATWTLVTVPLSAFPAGTYDGFWLQDGTGGTQPTVYVDDIGLVPVSR